MKIMICGKGGCGKSTVASLLAKRYAADGRRVLVIDTDESNYGLYRQLGVPLPADFTMYFGSKKGIFQKLDKNDPSCTPFESRWSLGDIPAEYTSENGGIRLMAVGKIHEAGEGCACPMGTLARCLLANLDLERGDVVIVDAEAGVEHFGRGVDAAADVILMVVDPSCESLMLSEKVCRMGKSIGKPVHLVLNKVSEEKLAIMKTAVPGDASVIAAIPENSDILLKGLLGEPLEDTVAEIGEIARFLDTLS